jgi:CBS domain-containing protein
VSVDSQTSLRQVASDILECQVEAVVVVDAAGALCGLITEQAVLLTEHSPYRRALPRRRRRCVSLAEGAEALYSRIGDTRVTETLSDTIVTATEDESITDVLERMLHTGVECAVVLRDQMPVGLIGRRDLLWLVARTMSVSTRSIPDGCDAAH